MAILVHDDLPGQPIEVPDDSVPIHEVSGWHRPRPPSAPESEELTATHPDGEAEPKPTAKKK
jgi:hypothetical protein